MLSVPGTFCECTGMPPRTVSSADVLGQAPRTHLVRKSAQHLLYVPHQLGPRGLLSPTTQALHLFTRNLHVLLARAADDGREQIRCSKHVFAGSKNAS